VTAFVYEWERYLEGNVQILGVSVERPEEGKKFVERVTRDCQEDRPHIALDPYPVRLLSDPHATLIRACGAENEGHWAGTIAAPVTYVVDPTGKVRWAYVSASAADRPSPVALAKAACAIAAGNEPPSEYPGKYQ
jgi:peroxiredoxin